MSNNLLNFLREIFLWLNFITHEMKRIIYNYPFYPTNSLKSSLIYKFQDYGDYEFKVVFLLK
jgi:hypothetical protein